MSNKVCYCRHESIPGLALVNPVLTIHLRSLRRLSDWLARLFLLWSKGPGKEPHGMMGGEFRGSSRHKIRRGGISHTGV